MERGNVNYQLRLEKILAGLPAEQPPRLLLHGCCAPCSSYVLEYLSEFFEITLFYYNPNISPLEEYQKREGEVRRLISQMPLKRPVKFLAGKFEPEKFEELAAPLREAPEGGERCFRCYRLRLEETAKTAAELGFDYFTTTLTISPLKNAAKLNEIGEQAAEKYGVKFLPSDFKKKGGFQRSIRLSEEYGLYRQNYCGCVYSKSAAEKRREQNREKFPEEPKQTA